MPKASTDLEQLRLIAAAGILVASERHLPDAVALVTLARGTLDRVDGSALGLFEDALDLTADRIVSMALVAELASFAAICLQRWADASGVPADLLLQGIAHAGALRKLEQ